ncbi:MAG: cyclic nucleotide-binding domain-containing protein [Candidatus Margulisiibacteriota bacterium]
MKPPPIILQIKSFHEIKPVIIDMFQNIEVPVIAFNNTSGPISGTVVLEAPRGWECEPKFVDLFIPEIGGSKYIIFNVSIPADLQEKNYMMNFKVRSGGKDYAYYIKPENIDSARAWGDVSGIRYLDETDLGVPAEIKVSMVKAVFAEKLKGAYIPGEKEGLKDALVSLGNNIVELTGPQVGYSDLSIYDVIIIGPKAYTLDGSLPGNNQQLLDYIETGGTLIVQEQDCDYHDKGYAPYPFKYEVECTQLCSADTEIDFLLPNHKIFRFPNDIIRSEFDGWVENRGKGFFGDWDKHYHALLSCTVNKEEKNGGLMICQHGRGSYIYTGYSFYRQVPAAVPGAIRMFANIFSLPAADVGENLKFLRKTELFAGIIERDLEDIARIMFMEITDDGENICEEGDEGNELYIVHSGNVDVIKKEDGNEKVVATIGAGACVGEMAILGKTRRTATLRANGDVELLVIREDQFEKILRSHPDIAITLLHLLVRRLSNYQEREEK